MKRNHNNQAMTEIIGTILLLAIAVSLFSVLSFVVMSYPAPTSHPSANIVATIDNHQVIIKHKGGDGINLDAIIEVTTVHEQTTDTIQNIADKAILNDNVWGIGEILTISFYYYLELRDTPITITIIDSQSNSVIMRTTLIIQ